ncbi:DUF3325 domain-containing protein [Sphingomonas cannabina]|uniref:DUF3325 domain-containing protein n=1 Tax=Sphingomonas cannabina TaxID=2899123 RepID=UPI001F41C278|nr:DUF3325 domain-containing protein [Sphingomonas cannabina]UIJ44333.1 DUF3325 domain-containing protein [Sphingomonas cannabina]
MIQLLAVLLALAGFAAVAGSMSRHQQDMIGRRLDPREARAARGIGGLLLVASLLADMLALGPARGAIIWCGHLSIGAWVTVAWLCWRVSRRARSR